MREVVRVSDLKPMISSGQEELRAELTKRGVPFKTYSVKLYDVTMEVGTVYSGNGIDWVAIENPDTHIETLGDATKERRVELNGYLSKEVLESALDMMRKVVDE